MQLGLHMGPPTTEAEAVHESVAFLQNPIPLAGPPCLASEEEDAPAVTNLVCGEGDNQGGLPILREGEGEMGEEGVLGGKADIGM